MPTYSQSKHAVVRAMVILALLIAPLLAVTTQSKARDTVLEASETGKGGIGFVLLVSLQRT